jgi:hypothetical protein
MATCILDKWLVRKQLTGVSAHLLIREPVELEARALFVNLAEVLLAASFALPLDFLCSSSFAAAALICRSFTCHPALIAAASSCFSSCLDFLYSRRFAERSFNLISRISGV